MEAEKQASAPEALRGHVCDLLTGACADGRLEELLEKTERQHEAKASGMMRLPPESTWALAYSAPPTPSERRKAASGMMRLPPESTWALAYSAPPAPSAGRGGGGQDLRTHLQAAFVRAASSGRLERIIEEGAEAEGLQQPPASPRPPAPGLMRLPPASTWALAYAAPPAREACSARGQDCQQPATGSVACSKARLRHALSGAASDGRLAQLLPKEEPEAEAAPVAEARSGSTVQAELFSLLAGAAADGRLAHALAEADAEPSTSSHQEAAAQDAESTASGDGNLKAKVRGLLSSAARDGRLCSTLGLKGEVGAAEAGAEDADAAAGGDRDLRSKVRGLLSGAARDGRLCSVLGLKGGSIVAQAAEQTSAEPLQARALQLLSGAASDGRLREALAEAKQDSEPSSGSAQPLQARARRVLSGAVLSGRLQEALAKAKQDSQQTGSDSGSLQARVCSLLRGAATDGRLREAMAEARKRQEATPQTGELSSGSDDLRARASSLLVAAAADGRLREVLARKRKAKSPAEEPSNDSDDLRAAASSLLASAVADGRLREVLAQTRQQAANQAKEHLSSSDDVQARAFSLLAGAAADGRLREALARKSGEAAEPSSGSDDVSARALSLLAGAAADGRLSEAMARTSKEATEPSSGSDDVRARALNLLAGAAADGRLREAVARKNEEVEEPSSGSDDVRARASSLLAGAAADGRLREAVARKSEEDVRARALSLLAGAAADGRLREAVARKSEEAAGPRSGSDDVRARALSLLAGAAADRRLGEAAARKSGEAAGPSSGSDDVRARAFSLLAGAAADGKLREAVARKSGEAAGSSSGSDDVRARALSLLARAAADGRLREAVARKSEEARPEEPDALHSEARALSLLTAAAAEGRLPEALARSREEAVQARASSLLMSAAEDGRLREMLARKREEAKQRTEEKGDDLDGLRAKACRVLKGAAADGRLREKLGEKRRQDPAASKSREQKPTDDEDRNLLAALRGVMSQAAVNGSLAQALAQEPKEAEGGLEALREQVCGMVVAAAWSGDLAKALAEENAAAALAPAQELASKSGEGCSSSNTQTVATLRERQPLHTLPSVGTWMAVAPRAHRPLELPVASVSMSREAASSQEGLGPKVQAAPWHLLPSAGTWLAKPPRTRALPQLATPPEPLPCQEAPAPEHRRESWHLLPSAGTWLVAAPGTQAAMALEPEACLEAPAPARPRAAWHLLPSAGTWLAAAPAVQSAVQPAAEPQRCQEVSASRHRQAPWHLLPSAGTWLAAAPQLPSLAPEPTPCREASSPPASLRMDVAPSGEAPVAPGAAQDVETTGQAQLREEARELQVVPPLLLAPLADAAAEEEEDLELAELEGLASAVGVERAGAACPPSPTHSESSSVQLLRELLSSREDAGGGAAAAAPALAAPAPPERAPAPEPAAEASKAPAPEPPMQPEQAKPVPLGSEAGGRRSVVAEGSPTRPAGTPLLRRPIAASQSTGSIAQKAASTAWKPSQQGQSAWKDPLARASPVEASPKLGAARRGERAGAAQQDARSPVMPAGSGFERMSALRFQHRRFPAGTHGMDVELLDVGKPCTRGVQGEWRLPDGTPCLALSAASAPGPLEPAGGVATWQVVHRGFTNVRSGKAFERVIGMKAACMMVRGQKQGNWVKLYGEPGYIVIAHNGENILERSPVTYNMISSGTCADHNRYPVNELLACRAAAVALGLPNFTAKVVNSPGKPEGCYYYDGSLWFATHQSNKGIGTLGLRKPICSDQADPPAEPCRRMMDILMGTTTLPPATTRVETTPRERDATAATATASRTAAGMSLAPTMTVSPSLFCFSVVGMAKPDVDLLKAQFQKRVSIFGCHKYMVFTKGGKIKLGRGRETTLIPSAKTGELEKVDIETLLKAWEIVTDAGGYQLCDWTVKVDLHTVFLPDRLQRRLRGMSSSDKVFFSNCDRYAGPPKLYGSVEILSRAAVDAYALGVQECMQLSWSEQWEERYLQTCLHKLTVGEIFDGDSVADTRCWSAPCTDTSKMAFYPHEDLHGYMACLGTAADASLSEIW